jgi:5-hydroxyisourate hydrolase
MLQATSGSESAICNRMGKLTTHVLDLAAGIPAAGMRIELHDPHGLVAEVRTNQDGRCPKPLLETLRTGCYILTFHAAEYFRSMGVRLPEPPFIDAVTIHFGVADPALSYHVPLLVTPWSYSTYRGS